MIDCHSHYYAPHFQPSMTDVPSDLIVIAVSENVCEAAQILDLSTKLPFLKPCAGIHPEYITSIDFSLVDGVLNEFDLLMQTHNIKMVGIGECGLDYSLRVIPRDMNQGEREDIKDLQKMVLGKHIRYGREFDLPLVMPAFNM